MVPGCRTYREDECRECEASNMCTDFWEMGLTDMIVDSGVRVAYEPSIAKWLHDMDRVRAALPMQMPKCVAIQSISRHPLCSCAEGSIWLLFSAETGEGLPQGSAAIGLSVEEEPACLRPCTAAC